MLSSSVSPAINLVTVTLDPSNLADATSNRLLALLLWQSIKKKKGALFNGQSYYVNKRSIKIDLKADIVIRKSKKSGYRFEVLGKVIGSGKYGKVIKVNVTLKMTSDGRCIEKLKNSASQRVVKLQRITSLREDFVGRVNDEAALSSLLPQLHSKKPVFQMNGVELLSLSTSRFFEGHELEEFLRRDRLIKSASVEQRLLITISLLKELQSVHDAGVVHRDIKPANIILDALCNVKIIDFGLSVKEGKDDGRSPGSPVYMPNESREVGWSGRANNATRDIFSMGLVISEVWRARQNDLDGPQNFSHDVLVHRMLEQNQKVKLHDLFKDISDAEMNAACKKRLSDLIYWMIKGKPELRCSIDAALDDVARVRRDYIVSKNSKINADQLACADFMGLVLLGIIRQINMLVRQEDRLICSRDFSKIKEEVLACLNGALNFGNDELIYFLDRIGLNSVHENKTREEVGLAISTLIDFYIRQFTRLEVNRSQCDKLIEQLSLDVSVDAVLPKFILQQAAKDCVRVISDFSKTFVTLENMFVRSEKLSKEIQSIDLLLREAKQLFQKLLIVRDPPVAALQQVGFFKTVEFNQPVPVVINEKGKRGLPSHRRSISVLI